MKKLFVIAMVAVTVFVASCSKTTSSSPNSYTFKGTTYPAASITSRGNLIQATNLSSTTTTNITNSNIAFGTFPTSNGIYRVINYNSTPVGNQIVIGFANTAGTVYASTGNDNVNATVTVASNGKVSISVPNVWLQSSISQSDSGQFSANITQP